MIVSIQHCSCECNQRLLATHMHAVLQEYPLIWLYCLLLIIIYLGSNDVVNKGNKKRKMRVRARSRHTIQIRFSISHMFGSKLSHINDSIIIILVRIIFEIWIHIEPFTLQMPSTHMARAVVFRRSTGE